MASQDNPSILYKTDNLQVPASQVVLIYTEWNEPILSELLRGAQRILELYPQIKVSVHQVPGCVEIPFAIAAHARHQKADAYIAFGCVIRGETPHFDYVCQSVTQGITTLNTELDSPVIFGVLTVNNEQQALDRLGGPHGHKGEEAALAAIKMIALKQTLSNPQNV